MRHSDHPEKFLKKEVSSPPGATFHREDILRILAPSVVVTALVYVVIFAVILPAMRTALLDKKKEMILELTNSVSHILDDSERLEKAGKLSRPEAQRAAIREIRAIRYGKEGKDYFWINDMTPVMVMHPYRTDLEGKNIADFTDPAGKHLFREFVETVSAKGAGYVFYQWQWKDDPTKIVPKLSYVKGFAPWGWILGTGIYLDDVNAEIGAMTRTLTMVSLAIFFLVLLLSFYIVRQGLQTVHRFRLAEEQVRQHRDRLEEEVQIRTKELRESNEHLELEVEERRLGERKLRDQQDFLHTVIESLPFPFYVIDAENYRVKIANSMATRSLKEWSGMTCHLLTHRQGQPCDGTGHSCPLQEVKTTRQAVVVEHVHCDRDGNCRNYEIHGFPICNDQGEVVQMIEVCFDITNRKKLEEKLTQMSITDPLTGMYNRRGFYLMAEKRLQLARRMLLCVYLFYADMDNLKQINDSFGHKAGDEAIVEMAALLKDTFRQVDITARLGGDEFAAILMDSKEGPCDAGLILSRLEERIAQRNAVSDRPYPLSLSYGVASYSADESRGLDDLLAEADRLMYADKKKKKITASSSQ